jgi:radical SAM protein with 4Fe4S-binding SPASM domain
MDAVLMPPYPKAETAAPLAAFRKLSVGLWSDPTGLLTFPEALALAEGLGAASVAIRNPDAPARPLLSEDRARAVAAYAKNPIGLERLTVHDLFLSEAFGLDPLRDYAGCAGAGTLAHVTAAGALVACRTLPLPLGNLAERPLAELWASPERKAARMRLSHTPDACAPCARKDRCRGGCPGLAKPDSGGRDASCSLEFN